MFASLPLRTSGALAALVALSVLTAGCVAKDRPIERFTLTADAGQDAVVAPGQVSHLSWNASGAVVPPEVLAQGEQAALDWETSGGANGSLETFDTPPAPAGLTLVELNVTAKAHTASDVIGLLAVPATPVAEKRAHLAAVGDIRLSTESGGDLNPTAVVVVGPHVGRYFEVALPAGGADLRLHVGSDLLASSAEGTLLVAVREPGGAVSSNATQRVAFDTSLNYTLVVPAAAGAPPRIESRSDSGALVENATLDAFARAHPGSLATSLSVAPAGQSLPGAEGAAAAAALALGAALCAALTRRR